MESNAAATADKLSGVTPVKPTSANSATVSGGVKAGSLSALAMIRTTASAIAESSGQVSISVMAFKANTEFMSLISASVLIPDKPKSAYCPAEIPAPALVDTERPPRITEYVSAILCKDAVLS